MYLKNAYIPTGFYQWEDYSDHYETGVKNKQNIYAVYEGIKSAHALVTQRGRVLASKGLPVVTLQYLINQGYIR